MKSETEKARESFGSEQTPPELIRAYGEVKKAALAAQQSCFELYRPEIYKRIISVLDEIIQGSHNSLFSLPLSQGGAGTSLHMNINEVVCSLVGEPSLHPLDDLARFQSTNDTFSTAVIIMVYRQLLETEEYVIKLQESLVRLEEKYSSVLMTGRTELQDALPITLGQVFAAWSGAIERDRWRLHKLKERLRTIPLGGTAIGTCFSAPRKYVFKAEQSLRQITGLPLCRSQNLTDAISNQDTLGEVAGGFRLLALNLRKISGDLLLYTSSLSGELVHGELQFGSTIMPLKANPVLLEYVSGLSLSVKHECAKIEEYAASGQLQLNPYLPFMAQSFLSIHSSLKKALSALNDRFFPGMSLNKEKIASNLASSPALINTLRSVIGYSKIKELSELIKQENPADLDSLKELISLNSDLTGKFLDEWFRPENLTTYRDTDIDSELQTKE
ncbi:MAG: fumarate lyase [Spirochaetales bacterium]|nr:fumarate lyase [Spirochaetales bacterium]